MEPQKGTQITLKYCLKKKNVAYSFPQTVARQKLGNNHYKISQSAVHEEHFLHSILLLWC